MACWSPLPRFQTPFSSSNQAQAEDLGFSFFLLAQVAIEQTKTKLNRSLTWQTNLWILLFEVHLYFLFWLELLNRFDFLEPVLIMTFIILIALSSDFRIST